MDNISKSRITILTDNVINQEDYETLIEAYDFMKKPDPTLKEFSTWTNKIGNVMDNMLHIYTRRKITPNHLLKQLLDYINEMKNIGTHAEDLDQNNIYEEEDINNNEDYIIHLQWSLQTCFAEFLDLTDLIEETRKFSIEKARKILGIKPLCKHCEKIANQKSNQ